MSTPDGYGCACGFDYPLPGRILRPLFVLAERHEAVYRATLPLWWVRWHFLHWRGALRDPE